MVGHNNAPIACERSKLYEEVWAEPVRTVAKRYGISDVGLAKICRKLRVPLPPRGYWAKLGSGQKFAKPKLPAFEGAGTVSIHPRPIPTGIPAPKDPEKVALLDREDLAEFKIQVPDKLNKPHPLVAQARSTEWPDRPAVGVARRYLDAPGLDIYVSKSTADRALRIMEAVLRAFAARGWPMTGGEPGNQRAGVLIAGQTVHFRIRERWVLKSDKEGAGALIRRKLGLPGDWKEWEFAGRLAVGIGPEPNSSGRCCREDLPDLPLESRLNDCMRALIHKAFQQQAEDRIGEKARLEEEERRRLWRIEDDSRRMEAERRKQEVERREALLKETESWRTSQNLRAYLNAVELGVGLGQSSQQGMPAHVKDWLDWGCKVANDLDPLPVRLGSLTTIPESKPKDAPDSPETG